MRDIAHLTVMPRQRCVPAVWRRSTRPLLRSRVVRVATSAAHDRISRPLSNVYSLAMLACGDRAEDASPHGLQRLPHEAAWDADRVCELRSLWHRAPPATRRRPPRE